nr:MAG TPA: hypothetical protein [Bacteriophage sp.]
MVLLRVYDVFLFLITHLSYLMCSTLKSLPCVTHPSL